MSHRIVRLLTSLLLLMVAGCPAPAKPPPPPVPVDPVPAPPPPDPEPVVDGDITVAYENGLRTLVKHVEAAELVTMQLYIKGGARFRNESNAGLEALAVRTSVTGGTQNLNKDEFDKELFRLGSEVGATSMNPYSMFYAKALKENAARTFELLADVFLVPDLPDTEVEIQRSRIITQIKSRKSSPDGQLTELTRELYYAGHPYVHAASGTVETIGGFSRDDLVAHMKSLQQTSRLTLVVVGAVEASTVRGWVKQRFGALPRGGYAPPALPPVTHDASQLSRAEMSTPTNYVEASFTTPGWRDPDFAASILGIRILRTRLFDEVRTKRSLSYAPSARHVWSADITRGSLYVSAVKADETMKVMLDEVAKLKAEPIPESELTGAKSVFITSQLMANESTDGQASWLALCDIVGGDYELARKLPDQIKAVTPAEVQAFVKTYVKNLQTVVVGKADVDEALFKSL